MAKNVIMTQWHRIRRNHTINNAKYLVPEILPPQQWGSFAWWNKIAAWIPARRHPKSETSQTFSWWELDKILSVPHRILFVHHNFPRFPSHSLKMTIISISIYIYIVASSPDASPTGLIGHELQCLQRNVWDRRFSTERCVEFEASFFFYRSFVYWMYATYRQYKNPYFCFSVKCVRCSDVCLILFPSYTSLFLKLIALWFLAWKKWSRLSSKVCAQLIWDAMVARGVRKAGAIPGPLPFVDTPHPRKWTNVPQERK